MPTGLDRQRRLPDDHLWDIEEPVYTGEGLARSFLSIIRKSEVVYYLNQRFRSHPGRKSKVSMEDLLLFYFLAAYKHKSVRRTDLCGGGERHRFPSGVFAGTLRPPKTRTVQLPGDTQTTNHVRKRPSQTLDRPGRHHSGLPVAHRQAPSSQHPQQIT